MTVPLAVRPRVIRLGQEAAAAVVGSCSQASVTRHKCCQFVSVVDTQGLQYI